jgi:hypothetical protein
MSEILWVRCSHFKRDDALRGDGHTTKRSYIIPTYIMHVTYIQNIHTCDHHSAQRKLYVQKRACVYYGYAHMHGACLKLTVTYACMHLCICNTHTHTHPWNLHEHTCVKYVCICVFFESHGQISMERALNSVRNTAITYVCVYAHVCMRVGIHVWLSA